MKSFLIPLLVAGAFVYHAAAQAPVGPGSVSISKLEPSGVKTPEFNVTGGPQKRSKIGTWLEFEVEFETKAEEIAELKFDYIAQVENRLITGSVTHINIPKGRDHYSVMYVAPRTLEKLTGGKPITSGSIQNLWVTVSTTDGVELDKKALKNQPIPNLPRSPGLLNKQETPFAPLFFDRYEAVKGRSSQG
jgi:hypothetical protein